MSLDREKHVQEGHSASIMCSLKEGDPPISFVWMKDGDLATSFPGIEVVSREFTSTLTILSSTSIHAGNYYCKAYNPVSWSMTKTTILVDGTD